ncbi:MAG: McrC family protein [Oscillospiraceae bacterium]|nr:McrC family protein [Oscillospiraceae bacterium]
MKNLKIEDNRQFPKEDFVDISHITEKVADKTMKQLEADGLFVFSEAVKASKDIDDEQFVLRSVNGDYRTGNIMGLIGCGDERLTITSRFCRSNSDFFLQYLLQRVLEYPNVVSLETDTQRGNQILDLLMLLFPVYLKQAMRNGVYKTYVCNEYNDCNVNGRIDVARHIAKNTPFVGNIAYSKREYSYDNFLTELIRHTIEFIRCKPIGRCILSKVRDEVGLIVDATPKYNRNDRTRVIADNKKNAIRHSYYREYRQLQRLCILILQHEKSEVGFGFQRVYGILFDGSWLWEEYVNKVINEDGNRFHHPRNRDGKGAQWLFTDNNGLIYPDFISYSSKNRIIADAKYKPVENIRSNDYLQMLAYMYRFDAKTGYYFYPEVGNSKDVRMYLNKGTTYEHNVLPRDDICVVKHGLSIPDGAGDYREFAAEMKESERKFRKELDIRR